MFIEDIKSFPKNQRILGLDIGENAIGLAMSDILQTIATPFDTILRKKFTRDAETLSNFIDEHKIAGLVIGLPLEMSGKESVRCQSTRQFARNYLKIRDIPIYFQDERLSSQAVENVMLAADLSRARRKEMSDKLAASYILQSFLDRIRANH
jgi:putative Holliday junction resolvase